MKITNTLSKNDFIEATRLFYRKYNSKARKIIMTSFICGLFIILGCLYIFVKIFRDIRRIYYYYPNFASNLKSYFSINGFYTFCLVIIFVFGILYIYRSINYPNRQQKKWISKKENQKILLTRIFDFNEEGIIISYPKDDILENFWAWGNFQQIYSLNDYFIFKISNDLLIIISKKQIDKVETKQLEKLFISKGLLK